MRSCEWKTRVYSPVKSSESFSVSAEAPRASVSGILNVAVSS